MHSAYPLGIEAGGTIKHFKPWSKPIVLHNGSGRHRR